jgi:hypothetical protein
MSVQVSQRRLQEDLDGVGEVFDAVKRVETSDLAASQRSVELGAGSEWIDRHTSLPDEKTIGCY